MYSKEDLDSFKQSLTINQIFDLVMDLGGEPIMDKDFFKSRTICHHSAGQGSYKLYYYDNTKLFKCYTACGDYFDIYELVRRQKTINENIEWSLPKSVAFVMSYFGYNFDFQNLENQKMELTTDWKILERYNNVQQKKEKKQIVELKIFDKNILKYLPTPHIIGWEQEGISREVMQHRGICYDPKNEGIVIPHFDINDNLIGIRERTLIKEQEKYGKYMPAKINNKMYNHPLSFNLYNLNNSKNTIKLLQKAIVFEGKRESRPSLLFLVTARGIFIPKKC